MWRSQCMTNSLSYQNSKYRAAMSSSPQFVFPVRQLESVPGVNETETLCRAEFLSDDLLNYVYVLYMQKYYDSPINSFEYSDESTTMNIYAEFVSETVEEVTIKFNPINIEFVVPIATHIFDENIKIVGGIPREIGSVPENLKRVIFNDIRKKIIEKTGPVQQFDPNELFGFKLYFELNHSGGGTSWNNPFIEGMGEDTYYAFWYNSHYSSINMQESTAFFRGSQENKIGISFKVENAQLKINQIRESNIIVERVQANYLQIFEKAMKSVARIATDSGNSFQFSANTFTANLCWMKKYMYIVYQKLHDFIRYSNYEFEIQLAPIELVDLLYPSDAVDYGGVRREFITRLVELTCGNNEFVTLDEHDFVSKDFINLPLTADFATKENVQLTDYERAIYTGIGSLIFYAAQSSHTHTTPLGPIFSNVFYEYGCCTTDVDKMLVLVTAHGSNFEKNALHFVMTASHNDVRDIGQYSEVFSVLEQMIDEVDEAFLAADLVWETFWTAATWNEAKELIIRRFNVLYRKYLLPFESTKAAMLINYDIKRLYSIPYIDERINLSDFSNLSEVDTLKNVVFKSCATITFQANVRDTAKGTSYLILAAILKYLSTGRRVQLTSAKDENNRKWIAKVTVDNLGYIKYFPRASNLAEFYYVKGAYEVVTLLAQKCRDRVQGVLDRERIVSDMVVNVSLPNVKVWLTNFILHQAQENVEKLLVYITGSKRLLPGQNIKIIVGNEEFHPHSCFKRLDVPLFYEHESEEFFVTKLEYYINS